MNRQGSLFRDLRAEAETWMDEHPRIYCVFKAFAIRAAMRRRRFGMKALAERVRWEVNVEWDGDHKINNNYVAYIGRRLIRELPDLEQWIETRRVRF